MMATAIMLATRITNNDNIKMRFIGIFYAVSEGSTGVSPERFDEDINARARSR